MAIDTTALGPLQLLIAVNDRVNLFSFDPMKIPNLDEQFRKVNVEINSVKVGAIYFPVVKQNRLVEIEKE